MTAIPARDGASSDAAGELTGRVALVTGGGKGVGAAISRDLAARGAYVIVNHFHSKEAAARTVAEILRAGGAAKDFRASVARPEAVREMFDRVSQEHGRLDILVNNAARGVFARFDDLTDLEWARAVDTNIHGARWCSLAAAGLMAQQGGGAIVNVSSIGAGLAMDNYMLVGVCKAALEAMTRYLAADLGPAGIRVNTASAGLLDNGTASLFPGAERLRDTCAAAAPLGRVGTEEDLAQLVGFLASPRSSWITGQSFLADGGLSVGRAMLTPGPSPGGQPPPVSGPEGPDDIPADETSVSRGGKSRAFAHTSGGIARPILTARRTGQAVAGADRCVAVVGTGLIAPGVDRSGDLWERLVEGVPQFSEPGERYRLEDFYSSDRTRPDRTYSRVAGFARPLSAGSGRVDLLEEWAAEALVQCRVGTLAAGPGVRTAVFAGAWNEGSQAMEESLLAEAAAQQIAAHWPGAGGTVRGGLLAALRHHYPYAAEVAEALPAAALARAADRVVGRGVRVRVLDTACSSSLYAIDAGTRALLDGECDLALCGGVFSQGPRYSILFSRLGGLSATGRVRALDADADGVIFSDGAGFVALKRLDRAFADGDRVLGVLAGFGSASDGQGKAAHAPGGHGQARALARARAVNGLGPADVDWVVAHATGTPAGDAVEREVLARELPGVPATSNKSVVGHTGWTAGVLSVIHALQGLEHRTIVAQAPYGGPPDGAGPPVPTRALPLPAPVSGGRPRTVGVSAFGFGGTGAHLLIQDAPAQGQQAPRSLPDPVDGDPVVIVAWTAHLPGLADPADVTARLAAGRAPSSERAFPAPYPVPSLAEVRLPPVTTGAIDPAQLMALQAVARLAPPPGTAAGTWWTGLQETTGVIAAHTGVPVSSPAVTLRCYARSLTGFAEARATDRPDSVPGVSQEPLPDREGPRGSVSPPVFGGPDLGAATDLMLTAAGKVGPAPGEDTLAGLMPNVIPARVAAAHGLHGLTMTVDDGPASGRTALETAASYLCRRDLDLALVLGVNGGSTPLHCRIHSIPEGTAAEGAFALVVTRASIATDRSWPVLAALSDVIAPLPQPAAWRTPRTYLAADDLIDVISRLSPRAACPDTSTRRGKETETSGGTGAETETLGEAAAPPHDDKTGTSPASGETAAGTRRHTLTLVEAGSPPPPGARPLPPRSLVVSSPECATTLRPAVTVSPGSRLVVAAPGDDVEDLVARALAEAPEGFSHLRTITSTGHGRTPATPPCRNLLAVQETAFTAVRKLRDALTDGGSLGFAILTPRDTTTTPPDAHLLTGLAKSLAWELPGCPVRALITDTSSALHALDTLQHELTAPPTGLPVVLYRRNRRLVYRLHESPRPAQQLRLEPGAVVVATGGARGITAACLLGLAERVPLRLHLLGSGNPHTVPDHLLRTPDHDLSSARASFITRQRTAHPELSVRTINALFDTLLRARESALTLHSLRRICGEDRVTFHTCDLTDPAAVRATAAAIGAMDGRVDLLVNGAGLHHPGDITRKTLTGMRRIRDVKLYGHHHLRTSFTGPLAPRLWCNFGSVTGIVGLPGETDYSPANDYLAAAAESGDREGEFTIAWTVWDETGLGSGPIVQSYTARTDRLSRMTTTEGLQHFLNELTLTPHDRLVTYIGPPEHRSFRAQFPGLLTEPSKPTSPPAPMRAGLLPPQAAEHTAQHAVWEMDWKVANHPWLVHHTVDARPTVPGTALAALAAEAAAALLPGHHLASIDDLVFSAWVRPRTPASAYRLTAEHTPQHNNADEHIVRIRLTSDTRTPDGRPLSIDREHFRALVRLTTTPPPPPPTAPHAPKPAAQVPTADPYYLPDSPVRLTGLFQATRDWHTTPTGCGALWHPELTTLPVVPSHLPVVLLDSLARTPALQPDSRSQLPVLVPSTITRITIHDSRSDILLAIAHGTLRLTHDTKTDTSTAATADGRVIARITGMTPLTISTLPSPINPGKESDGT
ncbi:SDR family oxidoreductase [Streptomyces tsukubensis]|uniref:SDR family oxidoreductase n=1 Tax=Streptomyces tsukubensis TaxID=83656 RepID=UPI00344D64A9